MISPNFDAASQQGGLEAPAHTSAIGFDQRVQKSLEITHGSPPVSEVNSEVVRSSHQSDCVARLALLPRFIDFSTEIGFVLQKSTVTRLRFVFTRHSQRYFAQCSGLDRVRSGFVPI
jgi:hypothetical protein